jgi:hypothetical protein
LTKSAISSRAAALQVAAFALLLIGLAAAVLVDRAARREEAIQSADMLAAAPLAPEDSKHYAYQMGQLTGPGWELFDRMEQAASRLLHGRPLAVTIAVVSFAASGALLFAADKASA